MKNNLKIEKITENERGGERKGERKTEMSKSDRERKKGEITKEKTIYKIKKKNK